MEEAHTSATCRLPNNVHNKSATRLGIKGGKTWNKEWINGIPTEWGEAGLDKDIVNINEHYINYIQYNPKLVQKMDNLAVADTGTTGNCLTLDSPCDNKQQAVHPLPIQMPNGEIITSMHTELLYHWDLPIQARKHISFQVSIRPCCPLGNCAIVYVKPPSMKSLSAFWTNRVERSSWKVHETHAQTCTC